jgi:hypothetical protein
VTVVAWQLLHPQLARACVSRQMRCPPSSLAMQACQLDAVLALGAVERTCTPVYVHGRLPLSMIGRGCTAQTVMLQCRTSSSKQPASCTFVLQGKAYVVLSSGVIAEADGRAAASGGWGATVALALEADEPFYARRQLHSGAAASSPATGAHLQLFPHSFFYVSRGLLGS